MPEPGEHYLDCTDPDCPGCLPSDEEVRAMSLGQAATEASRRGMKHVRAAIRREEIVAGADDYRARARAARAELA